MTPFASFLLAALTVAPVDRLSMADRLFRRGDYASAQREYAALRGEKDLEPGLSFRLILTAQMLGDAKTVRAEGPAFLKTNPTGEQADQVRLFLALAEEPSRAEAALRALDRDDVSCSVRAEALYRLAMITGEAALFARVVELEPKGRFAGYAKYRHAAKLVESADPVAARKGVAEFLDLAFGTDPQLARDALYGAAVYSYRAKRYGEATSLLKRYAKTYPKDERASEVRRLTALALLASGKYADALAFAEDEKDETLLYVKAVASDRVGSTAESRRLALKYLADFPQGEMRARLESQVAHLDFNEATRTNDAKKALLAARRCVALTDSPSDYLLLAWALEKSGDAENAEKTYAEIARRSPKSDVAADALYRRAMSLLRHEGWSLAEMSLAEALSTGKLPPERVSSALYWRGVCANRLGHRTEAVALLKKALEGTLSLDERREARLLLADADYDAGRTAEASSVYAELVREGALARMSAAKTLAVGKVLKGEEARACARALASNEKAEWRQAGLALLGDVEYAETNLTAAAYAYQKCMDEKCETEVLARVSLRYGQLLVREGNASAAEKVLNRAIKLNTHDNEARAEAYLALARAAKLKGDEEGAKGYATVVVTLFEKTAAATAAREMLK